MGGVWKKVAISRHCLSFSDVHGCLDLKGRVKHTSCWALPCRSGIRPRFAHTRLKTRKTQTGQERSCVRSSQERDATNDQVLKAFFDLMTRLASVKKLTVGRTRGKG